LPAGHARHSDHTERCNSFPVAVAKAGVKPAAIIDYLNAVGVRAVLMVRASRVFVGLITATLLPTFTSTAAQAQTLAVGNASGAAGQQVTVSVTLTSGGASVQGTQNDIAFAVPLAVVAKTNGKPDCTVNADINKGATLFAFRPNGCTGTACTSFRALVLATDNVDQIPSGSVLYTCKVNIDTGAANGDYPLAITGVILSDPNGNYIPGATGNSGTITVTTPTRTLTPTITKTPTPTATRTATPCVGTCHGGSAVTVDELLVMVNIALGNTVVSACRAGDANSDGAITINEVLGRSITPCMAAEWHRRRRDPPPQKRPQ
jgi:hypothetical protein